MKAHKKLPALLLAGAMVLALAACGGGGSGSGTPASSAPAPTAAAPASSAPESQAPSAAGGFPDHVITMIVNYSAGGGTDLASRALADAAAKALGGNITVTNLAGGQGSVGVTELANSKGDGYTIGVATLAPLALVPYQLDVSYTPDSFKYICAFGQYGYGIVVAKDSPYQTLDDLIEASKQSPVNFGATGYPQPLTMQDLATASGGQFSFVNYPSTTDMVADVLGGFLPCAMADMASFASYVKSGDMRLLAAAHDQRWEVAPDVQTLEEMGYDAVANSFMGLAVPADTPDEIVEVLREAFQTACNDATFKDILASTNAAWAYLTGDEYETLVRETYEMYSHVDFTTAD